MDLSGSHGFLVGGKVVVGYYVLEDFKEKLRIIRKSWCRTDCQHVVVRSVSCESRFHGFCRGCPFMSEARWVSLGAVSSRCTILQAAGVG